MRTLSTDIKIAADELKQKGRWVHLFNISVDATIKHYFTDYPDTIVYNSITYTPYPIAISDIDQTAKPEQHTLTITVANIDRTLIHYLEEDKLLDEDLTVIWAFIKDSDASIIHAFQETLTVISAEVQNNSASIVFSVGNNRLFKTQLPKNRWIDFRCEHVYRSQNYCHYGSDEFAAMSEIDCKPGGDGEKLFGWYALRTAIATKFSINRDVLDHLNFSIAPNVQTTFNHTVKNAPYFYKSFDLSSVDIDPNFTLEVSFKNTDWYVGTLDGSALGQFILITPDSDSPADGLLFGRRRVGNVWVAVIVRITATATIVDYTLTNTLSTVFRIQKIGSEFQFNHKLNEAATYGNAIIRNYAQFDRRVIRVGLTAETYSAGRGDWFNPSFDYFRLLTGGYTTCDRTLTGCRLRKNLRRFGGAPGIIHGNMTAL